MKLDNIPIETKTSFLDRTSYHPPEKTRNQNETGINHLGERKV